MIPMDFTIRRPILVAILFLRSTLPGSAQQRPEVELIRSSYLTHYLEQMVMATTMGALAQDFIQDENQAAVTKKAFEETFTYEKLERMAVASLEKKADPSREAVLEWMRGDLAKRVFHLNCHAPDAEKEAAADRFFTTYVSPAADSTRAKLFERLGRASEPLTLAAQHMRALRVALTLATNTLLPEDMRPSPAQVQENMARFEAADVLPAPVTERLQAFIFRDLDDAALERYVAFWESAPGKWWRASQESVILAVMQQAGEAAGLAIARDAGDAAQGDPALVQLLQKALDSMEKKDYLEAQKHYQAGLERAEQLAPLPAALGRAAIFIELSRVHTAQERHQDAESLARQGVELQEKLLGPQHPLLEHGLSQLSFACENLEKDAEACEALERALEIRTARGAEADQTLVYRLQKLVHLYTNRGAFEKAALVGLRTMAATERVEDPETRAMRRTLSAVALVEQARGFFTESSRRTTQAIELAEKHAPENTAFLEYSLHQRANCLAQTGNVTAALSDLERARKIAPARDEPAFTRSRRLLMEGEILRNCGRLREADDAYRQSEELLEKKGKEHQRAILTINRALVASGEGDHPRALALLERAVPVLLESSGPDNGRHVELMRDSARIERAAGHLAEARKHYEAAVSAARSFMGECPAMEEVVRELEGLGPAHAVTESTTLTSPPTPEAR